MKAQVVNANGVALTSTDRPFCELFYLLVINRPTAFRNSNMYVSMHHI